VVPVAESTAWAAVARKQHIKIACRMLNSSFSCKPRLQSSQRFALHQAAFATTITTAFARGLSHLTVLFSFAKTPSFLSKLF
jgi:hypothetical protein